MLDMQNVKEISIIEGDVRTIHDSNDNLLWGKLSYSTKYAGDTTQNGEPTPDAPVAINVVTGEQAVTIGDGVASQSYPISLTGKNMLDSLDGYTDGYIGSDGTIGAGGGVNALFDYMSVESSNTYTLSASETTRMSFAYFDESHTFISRDANIDGDEYTITTPANCRYVRVWVYRTLSAGGITQSYLESLELQFEKGSQATPYAPYYNYELCKIDTYQDYIYKSGDDWYVHKEIGKATFNGTESWSGGTSTGSPTYLYAYTAALDSLSLYSERQAFCSHFSIWPNQLATGTSVSYPCMSVVTPSAGTYAHIRLMIPLTITADITGLKTWLGSHNTTLYYVLATATDTKITDATLLSQLDAIEEWMTRYGYTSTITGNLPIIITQTNLE